MEEKQQETQAASPQAQVQEDSCAQATSAVSRRDPSQLQLVKYVSYKPWDWLGLVSTLSGYCKEEQLPVRLEEDMETDKLLSLSQQGEIKAGNGEGEEGECGVACGEEGDLQIAPGKVSTNLTCCVLPHDDSQGSHGNQEVVRCSQAHIMDVVIGSSQGQECRESHSNREETHTNCEVQEKETYTNQQVQERQTCQSQEGQEAYSNQETCQSQEHEKSNTKLDSQEGREEYHQELHSNQEAQCIQEHQESHCSLDVHCSQESHTSPEGGHCNQRSLESQDAESESSMEHQNTEFNTFSSQQAQESCNIRAADDDHSEMQPPLKKQRLMDDRASTMSDKAIQFPSSEDLTDNGYITVFQALPRECAREHPLIPNLPPCRAQDNQSDSSDGEDPSEDDNQVETMQTTSEGPSPLPSYTPQPQILEEGLLCPTVSLDLDHQLVPEEIPQQYYSDQSLYCDANKKTTVNIEPPPSLDTQSKAADPIGGQTQVPVCCFPSASSHPSCFQQQGMGIIHSVT